MVPLDRIELQDAGDGVEHGGGRVLGPSAFQPFIVFGADPREQGDFLAP